MQIIITALGFTAGAVYFLVSDTFKKSGMAVSIFLLIFGMLTLYYLFLQYLIEIRIDEQGIYFNNLMKNRQTYISFDEIKKIDMDAFQIENLNGPLTEAVPEVIIHTENKGNFLISPGIYANFHLLVFKLLQAYRREQDKKIDELARKIVQLHIKKRYGTNQ